MEKATATRGLGAPEIVNLEEEEEEEDDGREWEDWCFICKDGGTLLLCEFKDCPKVYHADCAKKEFSVEFNEDLLICQWHGCFVCNKRKPMLFCYCCPNAVCEVCDSIADFVHLKEDKGICHHCLPYIMAIEEIQKYDVAEGKIDLKDPNTFEGLLLEYWEIVKSKHGVTFAEVEAESHKLELQKKAEKSRYKDDLPVHIPKSRKKDTKPKYKDDPKFSPSDHEDEDRVDYNLPVNTSKSRKKGSKPKYKDDPKFSLSDHEEEDRVDYKRVGKTKKMEFIGWGSKPLIDFLTSIGEDTSEAMSQISLEAVIRKYIRKENLLDNEKKKKKVRCDEKLYSIFRKKSVSFTGIHKLLEKHLKENVEQMEYITRLEHGFGEKNETVLAPCKKQKTERSDEKVCEKEEEIPEEDAKPEMRSTGLATINAENIKLVYLRKSLVAELVKQIESFEEKMLGSFVKVRNDPRELMAHQILQVTGIKSADDKSGGVFLYVAGMANEVNISKLDDSDISKGEIEDLKKKVMSGLLRQPTVVEMKEKAKALHEDITKHWIARQLIILDKRINNANEKGLRRELEEYLEQRELLQKPTEQERLLKETPKIMEDLVEVKQESNSSGLSQEAAIDLD